MIVSVIPAALGALAMVACVLLDVSVSALVLVYGLNVVPTILLILRALVMDLPRTDVPLE